MPSRTVSMSVEATIAPIPAMRQTAHRELWGSFCKRIQKIAKEPKYQEINLACIFEDKT